MRFVKLEHNRVLIDGKPVDIQNIPDVMRSDRPQIALISLGRSATSQQLIDLLTLLKPLPGLQTQVIG